MSSKRSTWAFLLFGSLAISGPALAQPAPAPTGAEARAGEIARQMLPLSTANSMASRQNTGGFGGEMARLSFENVYMQLWTRPGLSLKDRSLLTIGMLIAMGNENELKIHFESGLRNGLTPAELEEIIYHASAYAGFPRASGALGIAREVIAQAQKK